MGKAARMKQTSAKMRRRLVAFSVTKPPPLLKTLAVAAQPPLIGAAAVATDA
jgi:hypothetical protein